MPCGCDGGIVLQEAAKNEKEFLLQIKQGGTISNRDITWAETARFRVYQNGPSQETFIDITDQDQFDINTGTSVVTVTILSAEISDQTWENAMFRLELIGSDDEPVAVAWGEVRLEQIPD